jgi:hypothetical protein
VRGVRTKKFRCVKRLLLSRVTEFVISMIVIYPRPIDWFTDLGQYDERNL